MPIAKIHVLEGRYDESRLGKVSQAADDGIESHTSTKRQRVCIRGSAYVNALAGAACW